jgi:flagellar hook assembly protein FlgD
MGPLLSAPTPNPARGQLSYSINLTEPAWTKVRVYDVAGRFVEELVNERLEEGAHRFTWNTTRSSGQAPPSGVYFLRVQADDLTAHQRFVLVR